MKQINLSKPGASYQIVRGKNERVTPSHPFEKQWRAAFDYKNMVKDIDEAKALIHSYDLKPGTSVIVEEESHFSCSPRSSYSKSSSSAAVYSIDSIFAKALASGPDEIVDLLIECGAKVELAGGYLYELLCDGKIKLERIVQLSQSFPGLFEAFNVSPLMVLEGKERPDLIAQKYPGQVLTIFGRLLSSAETSSHSAKLWAARYLLESGNPYFITERSTFAATDLAIDLLKDAWMSVKTNLKAEAVPLLKDALAAGSVPLAYSMESLSDIDLVLDAHKADLGVEVHESLEAMGRPRELRARFSHLLVNAFDGGLVDNVPLSDVKDIMVALVNDGKSAASVASWAFNTYSEIHSEEGWMKMYRDFLLEAKLFAELDAFVSTHEDAECFASLLKEEAIADVVSRLTKSKYTTNSDRFRIFRAPIDDLVAAATTAPRLGVIISNARDPLMIVAGLKEPKMRRTAMDLISGNDVE